MKLYWAITCQLILILLFIGNLSKGQTRESEKYFVQFTDMQPAEIDLNASSITHSNIGTPVFDPNDPSTEIHDSKITIQVVDGSILNNLRSNVTPIEISFTGGNVGDATAESIKTLSFVPHNIDIPGSTFDIHSDDTDSLSDVSLFLFLFTFQV